jgi:dienelactone hydrolase
MRGKHANFVTCSPIFSSFPKEFHTMAAQNKAAILASLPVRPDEDPFSVTIGGFYRRWFNLVDDLQALIDTVATIKSTEDEDWVPAWSAVAERFETQANAALARGDKANARQNFLEAKTFYSLARFPAPYHSGSAICPPDMSPIKARSYQKYLDCFHKATALRNEPQEVLKVRRDGKEAVGYLRLPKGASAKNKVPAVLVMCGGDMYKEDREKYADGATNEGLAALVVDAPGTGQTSFAHEPAAIVAWQAALDALQARPEIDGNRLGAFGVSRGGLWVMRLGAQDKRIKGLISCAPGGVGYWGTDEERAVIRKAAFERYKTNWFGPRGTKPEPKEMTEEDQRQDRSPHPHRQSLHGAGKRPTGRARRARVPGRRSHRSTQRTRMGAGSMEMAGGRVEGRDETRSTRQGGEETRASQSGKQDAAYRKKSGEEKSREEGQEKIDRLQSGFGHQ